VDGIHLAQHRDQWRNLVITVMNLRVLHKMGNPLINWAASSFSRRTLLHRVEFQDLYGKLATCTQEFGWPWVRLQEGYSHPPFSFPPLRSCCRLCAGKVGKLCSEFCTVRVAASLFSLERADSDKNEFSGWGVKLTTHLHLVPRLRLCAALPPLFHTSSWHQLYLYCNYLTQEPLFPYWLILL
jgi:hypothetical protein